MKKSIFKRWDGTAWVEHYFATSADIVAETTTKKILTADERTAIATYLNTFNAANKLVQLDANGEIPVALIPGGLDYIDEANGTFSGTLSAATGGSTKLDMKDGKLLFGTGTITAANPKWHIYRNAANLRLELSEDGNTFNVHTLFSKGNVAFASGTRVSGLASPTADTDAATKGYVDGLVAEGVRPIDPVKAATTGPITLSGTQIVDNVNLAVGDRVLVKNQSTAADNGIYTVASAGWSKVTADSAKGALVFVENGATNNDSKYYSQGTTWSLFSRTDTYGVVADGGLDKVGNNFRIKGLGVTNAMLASGILQSKIADFNNKDDLGSYNLMTAANGVATDSLFGWIRNALSAIKELRGTANYNTSNSQTIAGAYTKIDTKNSITQGTTDPGTTGYVAGDVYLQDIV